MEEEVERRRGWNWRQNLMTPEQARARMTATWADPERAEARRQAIRDNTPGRFGIPNGMNKKQAKFFWRQARFEAALTMNKLEKAGVLDDADEMSREALKEALAIMRMPIQQKDRLAAARLVLDFTKAKPAQRTELTVNKAEEWLAAVTEANGKEADEGDAGDAQASA